MVLRLRTAPRTYQVGARIAVGGMGEVYEGSAAELHRKVAIKRMLKSESTPELRELFLREVAVTATLEHPNVVEVIDAGTYNHDLYLVMEFVEGPSLAELLEALRRHGRILPVELACGIVSQVARGLAHAHERAYPDGTSLGIVHRDVAPENVLITRTGLPKLVDFGLATLSGHSFTTPGTVRGRPRALSPEQARGDRTDARSDIFSMGAMLFELLAGEQLYPNEALVTMLWKVVAGDYDPIEPRLRHVDADLVALLKQAVAVDPQDRFRSAREMERALDSFRAARGMRVESGAIASIISRLWSDVEQLREEKKEDSPGEMEGARVVLAADRLDTTAGSSSGPISSADLTTSGDMLPDAPTPAPLMEIAPDNREALRAGIQAEAIDPLAAVSQASSPMLTSWDTSIPKPNAPARLKAEGALRLGGQSELGWGIALAAFVVVATLVFWSVWSQHPAAVPHGASARGAQVGDQADPR